MRDIYNFKVNKKQKEYNYAALKAEIDALDADIELLSSELLAEFNADNQQLLILDDEKIVAEKFTRENIGYTSEADILNYLKNSYGGQYIKTKVTESLDKNALKKAIKTDSTLAGALASMTIKSTTEYIVVTDVESHQKMLEHINESKN